MFVWRQTQAWDYRTTTMKIKNKAARRSQPEGHLFIMYEQHKKELYKRIYNIINQTSVPFINCRVSCCWEKLEQADGFMIIQTLLAARVLGVLSLESPPSCVLRHWVRALWVWCLPSRLWWRWLNDWYLPAAALNAGKTRGEFAGDAPAPTPSRKPADGVARLTCLISLRRSASTL